jgi:hypothetical protein
MGRRPRHRAHDHDGELVPEVRNVEFSGAGGASEKFAVELLNLGQPDLAVRRPGVVRGDRATLR